MSSLSDLGSTRGAYPLAVRQRPRLPVRRLHSQLSMLVERLRNGLARRLDTTQRVRNPDYRRALWLRRYEITFVLDVGANTGQYVDRLRRLSQYTGPVVSFEPGSDAFKALASRSQQDAAWDCEQIGLGDTRGRASLHLADASVLNSFLPLREGGRHAAAEEVDIALLDDIAPQRIRATDRVLLKLDVQGYEGAVLRGARQTLRSVDVIECEVPLVGLYDDQPGCREMIDVLDDLGFMPFSVEPNFIDASTGHVVDADFVFARREPRLLG